MKGFRQKPKPKKSPARNLHKDRGRPVILNEVIAGGCPGHMACHQRGWVFSADRQRKEPCARATRRFYASHPEVIVDKLGNAWWPVDEAVAEDE